jgi:hypothetical protein
MKFIGKHIQLIGILLLTILAGAAAGLYFDVPARFQKPRPAAGVKQTFTCPMHPDVVRTEAGNCPKCGMALVPVNQAKAGHDQCGDNGENHPGCCAGDGATVFQLPPGHPPIHGWATKATPESASAPSNSSANFPH